MAHFSTITSLNKLSSAAKSILKPVHPNNTLDCLRDDDNSTCKGKEFDGLVSFPSTSVEKAETTKPSMVMGEQ